jgi:hypothetical protein
MSAATDITDIMWRTHHAPGQAAKYGGEWTAWVDTADGLTTTVHVARPLGQRVWTASTNRDDYGARGTGRTRLDAVRDLISKFEGEA